MATLSREERRREILEHALVVFSEKGYHAAKVEDIVSRAGVARGTFYLYFEDKRATFAELLDIFVARLKEAILRLDPNQAARPQLRENVLRALDLVMSQRDLARILLSHAVGVDPDFDRKLLDFYDAIAGMIERAVALGQKLGILRACDSRLMAYAFLGMVKEVCYRIVVAGYRIERERLADELLDQSLFGLFGVAGPKERRRGPKERRRGPEEETGEEAAGPIWRSRRSGG